MWTSIAIAVGFVAAAFLVAALPAAWMRRRHGDTHQGETRDLARDISTRIGLLHGLILGLVFGQVMAQAAELRAGQRTEAAAVEHLYYLARDYPAPAVKTAAARYVDAVIDRDWPMQRDTGEVSNEGWLTVRAMRAALLALAPGDARERWLAETMRQDLLVIERSRQIRGYQSGDHVPLEFWFAAIIGLGLIGGLMFVFAPTKKHLMIVGAYSIYAGLVLYMIYDISKPFGGLVSVSPDAFEQARGAIRSGL